jgi:hypothetical protein
MDETSSYSELPRFYPSAKKRDYSLAEAAKTTRKIFNLHVRKLRKINEKKTYCGPQAKNSSHSFSFSVEINCFERKVVKIFSDFLL